MKWWNSISVNIYRIPNTDITNNRFCKSSRYILRNQSILAYIAERFRRIVSHTHHTHICTEKIQWQFGRFHTARLRFYIIIKSSFRFIYFESLSACFVRWHARLLSRFQCKFRSWVYRMLNDFQCFAFTAPIFNRKKKNTLYHIIMCIEVEMMMMVVAFVYK